ncbi:MAG: hypothetical protein KDH95_15410 [Calditrichaeota bacterium]|nr:hypothetical protein [Calditrichota bacterium]MCB0269549.1 hypothetical protein [Calditrichota bacterium]
MNRPKYPISTILSVGKSTLQTGRSKQDALQAFGGQLLLDTLESQIQAFEELPTHIENRADLKGLTEGKMTALDNCKNWGGDLRTRMVLAFGSDSTEYRQFPNGAFNEVGSSDDRMIYVMGTLIHLATTHHEQLTTHGQTEAERDKGSQLLTALKAAETFQETKKDANYSATRERTKQLNEICETVNKVNKVGRRVFSGDPVNVALFRSKWPAAKKPVAQPVVES